jgi:hypothetical protein
MAQPINLDRIRTAEAEIASILQRSPGIQERTARFFESEGVMSEPEKLGVNLVLKVAPSVLERAETLQPKIAQDAPYRATGRLTRSAVLRLALLRGLEALENEYQD